MSLRQGQIKVSWRCTPTTPNLCPYQVSNFLNFMVSDIWHRQDFKGQGHYSKVERSNKVTLWCCTPTTRNQCPYQISTSYTLQFGRYSQDKIVKVTTAGSKVKSRLHHDVAHLHFLTYVSTKYQLPTAFGFQDIAQTRFIGQGYYGKVTSRSLHDVAHLHPLTNVPTKYQLPTPDGFWDIARKIFLNWRSLQQDRRSNQGHTMTLHTHTP